MGPPFTGWFESWGVSSAFCTALASTALLVLAFVVQMIDSFVGLPKELFPLSAAKKKAMADAAAAAAAAAVAP